TLRFKLRARGIRHCLVLMRITDEDVEVHATSERTKTRRRSEPGPGALWEIHGVAGSLAHKQVTDVTRVRFPESGVMADNRRPVPEKTLQPLPQIDFAPS